MKKFILEWMRNILSIFIVFGVAIAIIFPSCFLYISINDVTVASIASIAWFIIAITFFMTVFFRGINQ